MPNLKGIDTPSPVGDISSRAHGPVGTIDKEEISFPEDTYLLKERA